MGSGEAVGSVPLTLMQRARLLRDCLPLLFFVAGTIAVPWVLSRVSDARPPNVFYLFMAVVIAATLLQAVNRMRDLAAGVAVVREDRLVRSWRSRGAPQFWGQFERLGKLRLTPRAHGRARHNARNRVTFSPASKIVWALDPVE